MEISCKHCGQDIREADVSLEANTARCWACHAVFDVSASVRQSQIQEASSSTDWVAGPPPQRRREPVGLPEGIELEILGESAPVTRDAYRTPAARPTRELRLVRRWFGIQHVLMLVFSLFWCGGLFNFYHESLSRPDPSAMALLFPLLHVAVGVSVFYSAVAGLLNKTTITVKGGDVTIRHGPVPWLGNKRVRAASLDQLFCEEREHRSKNGTRYTYELKAVSKDGPTVRLLKGLSEPKQALYIEQALEEALGIVDVEVSEEWRGKGGTRTGSALP